MADLVKIDCTVATALLTSVFCGGLVGNQVSNEVVQFDGITCKWKKLVSMKTARCGPAATFYQGIIYVVFFKVRQSWA